MADTHSKQTRSYNMSRVKCKDTKPELLVRRYLFAKGFRFRLHDKKLPGKPDIVLPKYKTIIFINGCFWHGHTGCKYFTIPQTRTEWWREKLGKNIANDEKAIQALQADGWNIITVWGCELKARNVDETLGKLPALIQQNS